MLSRTRICWSEGGRSLIAHDHVVNIDAGYNFIKSTHRTRSKNAPDGSTCDICWKIVCFFLLFLVPPSFSLPDNDVFSHPSQVQTFDQQCTSTLRRLDTVAWHQFNKTKSHGMRNPPDHAVIFQYHGNCHGKLDQTPRMSAARGAIVKKNCSFDGWWPALIVSNR